jgi:membrane protease YdiL (CAAX protease family)
MEMPETTERPDGSEQSDAVSGLDVSIDSDVVSERWLFYGSLFVFVGYVASQFAMLALVKYASLRDWPELPRMFCVTLFPALFMSLGVVSAFFLCGSGRFFSGVCGFRNWRFYYPLEGVAVEMGLFIPFLALGAASFLLVKYARSFAPSALSPFFKLEPPIKTVLMNVGWGGFAVVAFAAVFVAPLVEEIAFRRVIYSFTRTFLSPFGALVLTSAVFAGFHMSVVTFPVLFCLGAVLQLLVNHHKSVYPAMFYHAAHNACAMILLAAIKYLGLAEKLSST